MDAPSGHSKLFGVFIGSTREDLWRERDLLRRRLLSGPFIPVAAEAFNAGPESKWAVIERNLRTCDYCVIIVGKRYGTIDPTDPEGRSYTEREYDFARSRMPVMVFLSREVNDDLIDAQASHRERLQVFRQRLRSEQILCEWETASELVDAVRSSLYEAMKNFPRPGWIRGDMLM